MAYSDTSPVNEQISPNGRKGTPRLTICIPTYKDNAAPLLKRLRRLEGAEHCELIIYDDGSEDTVITADIARLVYLYPGPARLVTATRNMGRAFARNRLIAHATTDWLLLLDADMLPDTGTFLTDYLGAIDATDNTPELIAGGFSLKHIQPSKTQALHAAQARKSECLTARQRSCEPGRYVFTSNILVHGDILSRVRFDEAYEGWGWEDVDWGLRVASAFPVRHIDNTATHLGLDDTEILLSKYARSGANFARMTAKHPEAAERMALLRAARRLSNQPGRKLIHNFGRILASDRLGVTPMPIRLLALKLFRAASYARYLP